MAGYDSGPSGDWKDQEPLISDAAATKFTQAMINPVIHSSSNWTVTSAGQPENELVYKKEYEVSKIVKRHTNKDFFYVISVSDTDDVFYQIWEGGWFSMLLFKAMGDRNGYRKTNVNANRNTQWDAVRKRTHLPATIGATYLEIDDAIEKHIEDSKVASDHDNYAEELLKTEPDNLKMIQGLEKLAEGEPEPDERLQHGLTTSITQGNVSVGPPYSSNAPSGTYSNNIAVSGQGATAPTLNGDEDMHLDEDTLEPDEDCDEFVRYVGR